MKQMAATEKSPQASSDATAQPGSAGALRSAVWPPSYGIEVLDHQPPKQPAAAPNPHASPIQPSNGTGLPARLKVGIESLSGLALDDVKVHYHSTKPDAIQALAYTQGAEIYVGPGQERHLPHEAWHVVQQKQGRVQPIFQMKDVAINDEQGLEHEAEQMGAKALTVRATGTTLRKVNQRNERTIQPVWNTRAYRVSNAERTLHLDIRPVIWGGTGGPNHHAGHRDDTNRPRALLFETISMPNKINGLTQRLQGLNNLWDVGLTVVLNRAYTPPKIYNQAGQATTRNKTQGVTAQQAKDELDHTWTQITANWQGPPLEVATAAWERREHEKDDQTELEQVQSTVPYSSLRQIAATNQGATAIETQLRTNHLQVWRKMGDDDMPMLNPNQAASAEMQKLAEVEAGGTIYQKNTFVTFGYNLTTANSQPPITGILQNIYRTEMELRDKIAELGVSMYPSEPTTYYQPVQPGSMTQPWNLMEQQTVGGSGQQLEGAKLVKAMKTQGGYHHHTFHTVMADTGAGARNDEIVALLNQWWNNGTGDPFHIAPAQLDAAINHLDQSALRDGEFDKVIKNLGIELNDYQALQIPLLVKQYREVAVTEACNMLKTAIQNRRYEEAWRQTMQQRWQKFG